MKNVPLKKRVIVRTNMFGSILDITHFLNGTFLKNPATIIPGMDVAHYIQHVLTGQFFTGLLRQLYTLSSAYMGISYKVIPAIWAKYCCPN